MNVTGNPQNPDTAYMGHPAYSGRPVYIVDGARTPFLKARGRPGPFSAADLAVCAARPLFPRLSLKPTAVDEVVVGCVMPAPEEANIARIIALRLGCGTATPAHTVQRNCASGLQALDSAALQISSGRSDLVLAGGTEAMSHAPLLFSRAFVEWLSLWNRQASVLGRAQTLSRFQPSLLTPVIGLLKGFTDPINGLNMGQTAEELAYRFDIQRLDADAFAVNSHHALIQAQEAGHLQEIIPLFNPQGERFDRDDGVRPDSTPDSLSGLRPIFDRQTGQVTAGNSSQITDGAAMLLLASEEALERHELVPLAHIVDGQWAALKPEHMGLGPVHASTPLLQRHGLMPSDIQSWEINEAFATQVLANLAAWAEPDYSRELGLEAPWTEFPFERLNPDGGAISLGHPVGASGARLVLHLMHSLNRTASTNHVGSTTQAPKGIATLCIGGGQGGAMLIEGMHSPDPVHT